MAINGKMGYLNQIAYSSEATLINSYELAKQMLSVDGCFVECGVGAGANLMALKIACKETDKKVWGFDSFDGIPLAGPNDDDQPGIGTPKHDVNLPVKKRMVSSGITVHNKENVLNNFKIAEVSTDNLELVEGWFIDTLPKAKTGKIALLRLDGDLYESTETILKYLYPKVVKGGIVIIDDYGLGGCFRAVADYFGDKLPVMIPVDGGVVYFKK